MSAIALRSRSSRSADPFALRPYPTRVKYIPTIDPGAFAKNRK